MVGVLHIDGQLSIYLCGNATVCRTCIKPSNVNGPHDIYGICYCLGLAIVAGTIFTCMYLFKHKMSLGKPTLRESHFKQSYTSLMNKDHLRKLLIAILVFKFLQKYYS